VNDPNWKPYKKKKTYEIFWMKTEVRQGERRERRREEGRER
jgi:hypothetical protein